MDTVDTITVLSLTMVRMPAERWAVNQDYTVLMVRLSYPRVSCVYSDYGRASSELTFLIFLLTANRFAGLRLEDLQGDMLPLCKDQFGCRYLQKKLEDGNPEHRDMIFNEIFPHFAELMTDPFANYLSQRLLEYSTDEQRDALIESISGELVSISLNMHGTRAVQKMIDYLSTQRQVQSLILALNLNVVTLIKGAYSVVGLHFIRVLTVRYMRCRSQR